MINHVGKTNTVIYITFNVDIGKVCVLNINAKQGTEWYLVKTLFWNVDVFVIRKKYVGTIYLRLILLHNKNNNY